MIENRDSGLRRNDEIEFLAVSLNLSSWQKAIYKVPQAVYQILIVCAL